jgi:hypothetical protein
VIPALLAQGGGGGGGQWMQLIGFILVVGLSALSWMFQKIAEQRQKKKAQDVAERRKLESLRTGRSEEAPAAPTASRQQDLAAKRQAQLEELRRRAADRARQHGQQPGPVVTGAPMPRPVPAKIQRSAPITYIPGSSGPIVVTPRRPDRAPQRSVPAPSRKASRRQQQQPRQAPAGPRPQQQQQQPSVSGDTSHGLLTDINTPSAPSQTTSLQPSAHKDANSLIPSGIDEWRRALVTREVLAPPLAIRAPDRDPLG